VQERTALTGTREAKHALYEEARRELVAAERKLEELARHRSVAEVEAAIASVLARPVMIGERVRGTVAALSANCTKDDKRAAEACAEIADLRAELAVANESAKVDARATVLREQVNELRGKGGSLAADPVGEFWSWLSRGWITVRAVGFGLPLFFALMIETVSAFGPLAIVAYAEATRRYVADDVTGPVAAGRAVSRHGQVSRADTVLIEAETGRVVQFMADRTEPTADPAAVAIEELHTNYELWCLTNGLQPLSCEAFADEFDRVREVPQLEGKIRKFGSRYCGIRLIDRKVAKLPARSREK
jgi:hypothetical protein